MTASTTSIQHTPGPWNVYFGSVGDRTLSVEAGEPKRRVADIQRSDEMGANARLIAAAPDLLAALKAALPLLVIAAFKAQDAGDALAEERYTSTLQIAEAAVSRATDGGAQ